MKNWKEIAKELLPDEFNEFMDFGGSGRRPDAVEFADIETDVQRRDLTINALFFDIDAGEVVDLVGGISDLRKGIVRTVGKAEDRFGEDRLRILRAIRFAARFGSDLDPAVNKALKKDSKLDGVSPERIRDEFLKGLKTAKSVVHFMTLIERYDLFDWIFNGVDNVNKTFVEERDPAIVIAWMLFGNETSKLAKDLNKLTYSSGEVKAITFLVALRKFNPNKIVTFKKMQKQAGLSDEQIRDFAKLASLDSRLIDTFLKFQLSVTGQDAMNAGIEKGPAMGKFINDKEVENFSTLL